MSRIVVAEDLSPAGLDVLRRAGHEVVELDGQPREKLIEELRDADALLVRSATKVDRELLEAAPRLTVVGRAGVGVDNVDVPAATARGILVINAPTGQRRLRGRAHLRASLRASSPRSRPRPLRWKPASGRSRSSSESELSGKTLGIIGLGQVGSRVAVRARAFEAKAARVRPVPAAREGPGDGSAASVAAGASRFLRHRHDSRHGRRRRDNRSSGREEFGRMRQGSILVNVARGKLVDREALLEALSVGPARRSGARRLRSGTARRRRSACAGFPTS